MANIQRGLALAVTKSDNAKMEKAFKGKIGEISFDFGQTLARGAVNSAPERVNLFDACGMPKHNTVEK